jgi:hypothetical protein
MRRRAIVYFTGSFMYNTTSHCLLWPLIVMCWQLWLCRYCRHAPHAHFDWWYGSCSPPAFHRDSDALLLESQQCSHRIRHGVLTRSVDDGMLLVLLVSAVMMHSG